MEYKKTLNMQKSGFPMRGNLPNREPAMLAQWQEMDLYGEMLKKNEGKPRFSLHDGPDVYKRQPPCRPSATRSALPRWTGQ